MTTLLCLKTYGEKLKPEQVVALGDYFWKQGLLFAGSLCGWEQRHTPGAQVAWTYYYSLEPAPPPATFGWVVYDTLHNGRPRALGWSQDYWTLYREQLLRSRAYEPPSGWEIHEVGQRRHEDDKASFAEWFGVSEYSDQWRAEKLPCAPSVVQALTCRELGSNAAWTNVAYPVANRVEERRAVAAL
ncbi:hypothetical protein [Myxococcus xanthus]|uniref:hypothetical protein n=1 Tax=Myxococcus xanthus TaxID=34 RepID=UPI00112BBF36|nr:hypothetical protein [Myxococcus xanthus]QDE83333.1 hypothetical protein BHS07_18190 [Myxococcus xanthus]